MQRAQFVFGGGSAMEAYNESVFETKVANALEQIKLVLDNERAPRMASDVAHSYTDKYLLAEFLTNISGASLLQVLGQLGLTNEKCIKTLKEWANTRSVSLRFDSTENCEFLRMVEEKVEADTQHVTEVKSIIGNAKVTNKVVTTVRTYFWNFEATYSLFAFKGNDPSEQILLQTHTSSCELQTSSDVTPKPKISTKPSLSFQITWLLQQLNSELLMNFTIDRKLSTCRTPRRNIPVNEALLFHASWFTWASSVHSYLVQLKHVKKNSLDMSVVESHGMFVPVIPLLELPKGENGDIEPSTTLPISDFNAFLGEQKRALTEKVATIKKVLPTEGFVTFLDGILMNALLHSRDICQSFGDGIDYIESMIRAQLVAAIGKELTPQDFKEYMIFHNRKLFKPEYQPNQFSHAIRRPNHDPEGVLSIEVNNQPIYTNVRVLEEVQPMRFAINAATEITTQVRQHLHAYMDHTFSTSHSSSMLLELKARARQFSSFILVIGTVISATEFDPKHAVIIQNKDDLLIPLLQEQIPTPKAFRDAIDSLSPDQQNFAKAFRSMQLDSTLFGICVIQIKPQLELLLNLPDDALTKEIKLTQDLMTLFIDYQIPSDLLSFEGQLEASKDSKVDYVKNQTQKMRKVIQDAKDEELAEAKRVRDALLPPAPSPVYSAPPSLYSAPPPMAYAFSSACAPGPCPPPGGAPPPPRSYGGPPCPPPSGAPPPMMGAFGGGPPCPPPGGGAPPPPRSYGGPPGFATFGGGPPCPPPGFATFGGGPPCPPPCGAPPPMMRPPPPSAPSASPVVKVVAKEVTVEKVEKVAEAEKIVEIAKDVIADSSIPYDVTKLPSQLNNTIEELDTDAALHSTIIKPSGGSWEKQFKKSLLAKPSLVSLDNDDIKTETNKAFDLLDSLSRSGALDIAQADFHILIGTTHCFDRSLIETVVKDNVNPIEKVERSMLIVGTTIHEESVETLIKPEFLSKVKAASPNLFPSSE